MLSNVVALSTIADDESLEETPPVPIIDPSDLAGRTFLIPSDNETGQGLQAKIVKTIEDNSDDCAKDSYCFKLICSMKDGTVEEILG